MLDKPMTLQSDEGTVFIPTFRQRLALLFPAWVAPWWKFNFKRRNVVVNIHVFSQHKPGEMMTRVRFLVGPFGAELGQPVPKPDESAPAEQQPQPSGEDKTA